MFFAMHLLLFLSHSLPLVRSHLVIPIIIIIISWIVRFFVSLRAIDDSCTFCIPFCDDINKKSTIIKTNSLVFYRTWFFLGEIQLIYYTICIYFYNFFYFIQFFTHIFLCIQHFLSLYWSLTSYHLSPQITRRKQNPQLPLSIWKGFANAWKHL